MNTKIRKATFAVSALVASGALLAGCGSDNPVDSAKDKAGDAVDSAKDKAGDAADSAKDKAGDAMKGGESDGDEGSEVGTAEIEGPNGTIEVKKPIAEKYEAVGGAQGHLGDPTGEQQEAPDGGYYADFEGASIYWSPETGAHYVQGKIKDAWMANGGVEKLGYPTSDEHPIDNGLQSDFQNGDITYIDDQTEIEMND